MSRIGNPPRERNAALYFAACVGLTAFSAIVIAGASGFVLPVPWYVPLRRSWVWSALPPGDVIAMDYYARVLLAAVGGVVVAIVAFFAVRRRPLPESLLRAAGLWAIVLTTLGMGWYAWALSHRTVMPPPDVKWAAPAPATAAAPGTDSD